jgi:hypothetical protein
MTLTGREEATVDTQDPQATPVPPRTAPENPKATTEGGIESVLPGPRFDPWHYREDIQVAGGNLTGYKVEATDGSIGKVDAWTGEAGASYLVVDTGPWIFGHQVMIPAGTINHIDHQDHRVYLDRTKEQIKSAPAFDPDAHGTEEYRDKVGSYYTDTYGVPDSAGGIFPPGAVPPGGVVPPPR